MGRNARDRRQVRVRKEARRRRRDRKRVRRPSPPPRDRSDGLRRAARKGPPPPATPGWEHLSGDPDPALAEALLELVQPLVLTAKPGTERDDDEEYFLWARSGVAALVWNAYAEAHGDLDAIDRDELGALMVHQYGLQAEKVLDTVEVLLERRVDLFGSDFRHVAGLLVEVGKGRPPELQVRGR